MRFGILVFARYDSRRLPGKVLLPIAGTPMLSRVLGRLRHIPGAVDLPLVLATSDRTIDDAVARLAEEEGAAVFRGAADDVAGRALAAARAFGFDAFVRISGDSPFIVPELVGEFVAHHESERPDLTTNVAPRTYPFGISVEVIATAAMARLLAETEDPDDREHVTKYFYRAGDRFRIANLAARNPSYAGVRLVVDTEEDLARAEWIAARTGSDTGLDEIVALAREWPEHSEKAAAG